MFGSLNKPSKLNQQVADLWDQILEMYPTAHLMIKRCDHLHFQHADRVQFLDTIASYQDYLALYNQIDVALDTFPYAGTTTTCESLLMGTPVVTLSDKKTHRVHQNTTTSLLINSGLSQFVATTPQEYLTIVQQTVKMRGPHLKPAIQYAFLHGSVTNGEQYLHDYKTLLMGLGGA